MERNDDRMPKHNAMEHKYNFSRTKSISSTNISFIQIRKLVVVVVASTFSRSWASCSALMIQYITPRLLLRLLPHCLDLIYSCAKTARSNCRKSSSIRLSHLCEDHNGVESKIISHTFLPRQVPLPSTSGLLEASYQYHCRSLPSPQTSFVSFGHSSEKTSYFLVS